MRTEIEVNAAEMLSRHDSILGLLSILDNKIDYNSKANEYQESITDLLCQLSADQSGTE